MLQVLDGLWKDHLQTMDQLRQGIHLRAYANKNPKQEYKREAFELFEVLLERFRQEVVRILSHLQIKRQDEAELIEQRRREEAEHNGWPSSTRRHRHCRRLSRNHLNRHSNRWYAIHPRWAVMIHVPVAVVRSTNSVAERLIKYERLSVGRSAGLRKRVSNVKVAMI